MREIKFRAWLPLLLSSNGSKKQNVSTITTKKVNLFLYKAELAYIILPLINKKYNLEIRIWDNNVDVSNSRVYYYNDNIKVEVTLFYKNNYRKITLQMIVLGDKFCENKIRYQEGFDNFLKKIKNTTL